MTNFSVSVLYSLQHIKQLVSNDFSFLTKITTTSLAFSASFMASSAAALAAAAAAFALSTTFRTFWISFSLETTAASPEVARLSPDGTSSSSFPSCFLFSFSACLSPSSSSKILAASAAEAAAFSATTAASSASLAASFAET